MSVQRQIQNIIRHSLAIHRLVREIMMNASQESLRVTGEALAALQSSSETYLTQLMEDSYLLALHRHRVTLLPRDMQITLYIRNSRA